MSTNLVPDLDDVALEFRQVLDDCNAYVLATSSPDANSVINHRRGVTMAIEVHAVTQFVIDSLPINDVHNRERFFALNQEAKRLTKLFWKQYNIILKGTSPAPISTVKEVPVPEPIAPKPIKREFKPAQSENGFSRLPNETVKMLYELFDVVGVSAKMKDIEEIASQVEVNPKTVLTRYYKWRNKQGVK